MTITLNDTEETLLEQLLDFVFASSGFDDIDNGFVMTHDEAVALRAKLEANVPVPHVRPGVPLTPEVLTAMIDGGKANAAGQPRDSNPYAAAGNGLRCVGWYAGWDA